VTVPGTALARRRRTELVERVRTAGDVAEVFAVASPRLRRLVPFDAAAWVSTDPATGLPSGPIRLEEVEGISAADCSELWRREFMGDDVNRFSELRRARRPAATLRAAARDPERSTRYRTFLRPLGVRRRTAGGHAGR
jgi:hypothetical protein